MGAKSSPIISTRNGQTQFSQGVDEAWKLNDGTVDRIIIGKLPDGTYGIVVSKPGVDVKTLFA